MTKFDRDYFEDGIANNVSLYENYRWIPELTIPMAHELIVSLEIKSKEKVLDFGCAKGYLVKALRLLGVDAHGVDISDYALGDCPKEVENFLYHVDKCPETKFDLCVAKDVLEHVPHEKLEETVNWIMSRCNRAFVAVPLGNDRKYVIPQMELDKTHIIRKPLEWWVNLFKSEGYNAVGFHKYGTIKDKWVKQYPFGNGFIIVEKKW